MTPDEEQRLPTSVGGIVRFAAGAWSANAGLYVLMALGILVVEAVLEWTLPAAAVTSREGMFKFYVLQYAGLFADALVVATVAIGVASRAAGLTPSPGAIAGGAVERWLPVIAVNFLAQSVVELTAPLSGIAPTDEPRAAVLIAAPFVWIIWAILGLAGPFVALSVVRGGLSVMVGFGHAFRVSLHRTNFVRLCGLAAVCIVPLLAQYAAFAALLSHHVARPFFWANVPLDVLTIGPLSALQTVFALDFARRVQVQRSA